MNIKLENHATENMNNAFVKGLVDMGVNLAFICLYILSFIVIGFFKTINVFTRLAIDYTPFKTKSHFEKNCIKFKIDTK